MKSLYLSLGTLIFIGCSSVSSTSYTLLSTNKVEIPSIQTSDITIDGESCSAGIRNSHRNIAAIMNQAIQNAIENGKKRGFEGNFLVDVEVTQKNRTGFLFSKTCFNVKGKLATIQKK